MPSVIRCLTAGNPARPPKPSGIKKPVKVTTPQPATILNQPVFTQPKMNEIIIPALTDHHHRLMLCPLSQKTKAGPSTPNNPGPKRPQSNVVFLCPSKTRAALCRAYSVTVGCIGRALKSSAGSWTGVENPMQSATQCFSTMGGGKSILTRKPL